jgi:acetyl esterase
LEGENIMAIDPQTQKLLDNAKASGLPPVYWLPVEEGRKRMEAGFIIKDTPVEVGKVEDKHIPCPWGNMMVRVYTPKGYGPFPILVFFHGGGWVLNSVATHDSVCRHITKMSECIVVSVEYRLSPECKFPGPVEDAYTATQWVYDNAKTFNGISEKIAVGGDSSGGNQAAVICLLSRDRNGPPIKMQILIYPATDYIFPGTKSYIENANGFSLSRDMMMWFWNHYLPSRENVNNPYICPMRAASLQDLPPALILTAEYDPLRDEGELYAKKLSEAGVNVKLSRYDGLMHGFIMQWRVLDKGFASLKEISGELKTRLYDGENSCV